MLPIFSLPLPEFRFIFVSVYVYEKSIILVKNFTALDTHVFSLLIVHCLVMFFEHLETGHFVIAVSAQPWISS